MEHDKHGSRRRIAANGTVVGRACDEFGDGALEFASPFGLHGWIDDRGEGAGQASVRHHIVDESPEEGLEIVDGRPRRVARFFTERRDLTLVDGRGQRFAGGEMSIERSDADAGTSREVIETQLFVAIEYVASGRKDRVPIALRVCSQCSHLGHYTTFH